MSAMPDQAAGVSGADAYQTPSRKARGLPENRRVRTADSGERLREALREIEPEVRHFAEYCRALVSDLVGQQRLQWQERAEQFDRLAEIARAALAHTPEPEGRCDGSGILNGRLWHDPEAKRCPGCPNCKP